VCICYRLLNVRCGDCAEFAALALQLVSYILFIQQKTCFNLHVKDSLELVDAGVMAAVLAVVVVVAVVVVALVHAGVSAKRYYHTLPALQICLSYFVFYLTEIVFSFVLSIQN